MGDGVPDAALVRRRFAIEGARDCLNRRGSQKKRSREKCERRTVLDLDEKSEVDEAFERVK